MRIRRRAEAPGPGRQDGQQQEGPENPARRAARLHRRRRLLLVGALPAAALVVLTLWCLAVFGLTLAAGRAYTDGDYETATSRYRQVAALNPWLEQWRVHYNIGTALYSAGDLAGAQGLLETALEEVPQEEATDPETGYKPADSPECRVRYNLVLTHLALAAQAREEGGRQASEDHVDAAAQAAGQCEVPSPQSADDPSQDPSASPSGTASGDPGTPEPQEQSSSGGSGATPSSEPGSSSTPTPSEEASPQTSSSAGPSQEASVSPSVAPDDEREQRLRNRNEGSPEGGGTVVPGDDQDGSDYRPW
ncbi:tetratricopeptide repeat protein [Actinomyces wuliandei]|uniref:tetratricopeptide repeat protein n=1 Tax=Actinomyces wuliandei TaxID=2057743 RepID=UPI0013E3A91C|nr:tetratricopeptide repeat protein [Actinomyces wuliandei]